MGCERLEESHTLVHGPIAMHIQVALTRHTGLFKKKKGVVWRDHLVTGNEEKIDTIIFHCLLL